MTVGKRNAHVDAYIARAGDFARPILEYIRAVVHAACPDVEETMKWSFPHFDYRGMMCSMAAFKEHCSFGFWKASLILDKEPVESEKGMGQFGRITKLSDLPSKKVLTGYIKKAMKLNEDGVKAASRTRSAKPKDVVVPEDLAKMLQQNDKARAAFEKFSPSHKREYVEWITEAKTQATRSKRLETTIEWLAEGKARNWKYM
jgi:uncharacterized protein YdeI (YjbR/CyaY-like superfamily)